MLASSILAVANVSILHRNVLLRHMVQDDGKYLIADQLRRERS